MARTLWYAAESLNAAWARDPDAAATRRQVHYGHSCLVPIDVTSIKMLYVFVDIGFDTKHVSDAACSSAHIAVL